MIASLAPLVLAAVLGAFTWSFLEYVIHRWLGHDRRFRGNPFGTEHLRHHIEGDYFAPSWKKAIFAVVVSAILSVPAVLLAGALGAAWVAGFVVFYGAYEVLHRREHTHAGIGPYGRWARRHHLHHHFSRPQLNHGVTSPLWDWVFGTLEVPQVVKVPRANALPWMLRADGQLEAGLEREYQLVGRA